MTTSLSRRLVALFFVLGILTGCQATRADDTQIQDIKPDDMTLEADGGQQYGGELVVGVQAESSGWDPNLNLWAQAGQFVVSSVLEPLSDVSPEGNLEPRLATNWEHSPDYREWTITVRDDVQFHNGEHLDAELLRLNLIEWFKRTPPEKLTATARIWLTPDGEANIHVVGPYSVRVGLTQPYPEFAIRNGGTQIVAKAMLDDPNGGPTHPIGTGPFVFQEWQQDKEFKAKRFDHYWRKDAQGHQLPYLDSIRFRPISDEQTRAKALRSSDIDMGQSLSAGVATSLDPNYTVLRDFDSERTLIVLNGSEGTGGPGLFQGKSNAPNPFTNIHARRAIAYAIDREQLTGILGVEGEVPSSTPQPMSTKSKWALPTGEEGYYSYDVDKAKAEVEAYKKETGHNELRFEILLASSTEEVGVFEAVHEQLTAAGIEMNIINLDQTALTGRAFWGMYQATGWRWFGSRDPLSAAELIDPQAWAPVGDYAWNIARNQNPIFDQDLDTLRRNPNENTRRHAFESLSRNLNSQAFCIWLHDTPWSLISDPRVHGLNGFRLHPFGNYQPRPFWDEVWKER